MTRRRGMFEIEIPDEAAEAGRAEGTPAPRPGPMAAAVRETAEAARERSRIEAEIRAENDRLAHEFVALRRQGLVVQRVPLEMIDATRLVRDRADGTDLDLGELVASIEAVGLSNPVRLERGRDGRFELVQGLRRLEAYRWLNRSSEEKRWAEIPAIITDETELEVAYRRMVDENLVRKDVSFGEMAALALAYAADPSTSCDTVHEAVSRLFASAAKQKRTYIRGFAELLELLAGALRFPEALPRDLGLELRRRLIAGEVEALAVREALAAAAPGSAEDEVAVVSGIVTAAREAEPERQDVGAGAAPRAVRQKAKTTFRMRHRGGDFRFIAADGKLEVRGGSDFSGFERRRLEQAAEAFLDRLYSED